MQKDGMILPGSRDALLEDVHHDLERLDHDLSLKQARVMKGAREVRRRFVSMGGNVVNTFAVGVARGVQGHTMLSRGNSEGGRQTFARRPRRNAASSSGRSIRSPPFVMPRTDRR